jgi:hypothetical protein
VAGSVKPTEEEIFTSLKRYTSELQVLIFVVHSEADGKELSKRLRSFKKSDTLQMAVPPSLYIAMDTIIINAGMSDTTVERIAYEIGSSRVSKTFYSSKAGWLVLYLLDRHPNPVAAKQNSSDRRHSVEKILRSRIEAVVGENYYYKTLVSKHAQADSNIFNLLADSIVLSSGCVLFWKKSWWTSMMGTSRLAKCWKCFATNILCLRISKVFGSNHN